MHDIERLTLALVRRKLLATFPLIRWMLRVDHTLDDRWFNWPFEWRSNMTTLGMIVSTLMIIVGANAVAASQSCQDTSLKRQVVHYASSLTRGYYAKW